MIFIQTSLNDIVIQAAIETLSMVIGQNVNKIRIQNRIENGASITVNLVGDVNGYICLRFTDDSAKQIASMLMMGMPIDTLNEMAISALSELGNMISGSTATYFSELGLSTDISTPYVVIGNIQFESQITTFSIEGKEIQLKISLSTNFNL